MFFAAALLFVDALFFLAALLCRRLISFSLLQFSCHYFILLSPQFFCCHLNSRGNIKRQEKNKAVPKKCAAARYGSSGLPYFKNLKALTFALYFAQKFNSLFQEINFEGLQVILRQYTHTHIPIPT